MRTIVENGCVIAADDAMPILDPGEVVISGSVIESVGEVGHFKDREGARIIDATGSIVCPGFVDTHRHVWQMPMRGIAADLIAPQYRSARGRIGDAFTPEDLYVATLAGVLEALDSGITTIVDWAHIMNSPDHADASIAALRDSHMRAIFTHGTPSDRNASDWYVNSSLGHPEDARRVRESVLNDDNALVTMMIGLRAPKAMSESTMVKDWAFARELDVRLSVDAGLGGGMWTGAPDASIQMLMRNDCLGPDTTYVHGNNLSDLEIGAIADSGGSFSVSACSELHVGHGLPATGRLLKAGIRPGLSVDIVSQVGGDMFGTMRSTLEAERGRLGALAAQEGRGVEPWEISTIDILKFATIDGAQTCGLGEVTGSMSPGKQADLIVVRCDRLGMTPLNNPIGSLVLAATVGDVDTVFVAGELVKQDGKLLNPNLEGLRSRLIETRDRLFATAGIDDGTTLSSIDPAWIW